MGNFCDYVAKAMAQNQAHKIHRWFRILLIVAAYGYLAYALLTFEHYGEFAAHFSHAGWKELLSLALAGLLFPINILMESEKWRSLLSSIIPISRIEAQRQVYYGFVGALLTPDRLGDYPARASLLPDGVSKMQAIALGFSGSMVLAAVNIAAGIAALLVCGMEIPFMERRPLLWTSAFFLLICAAVCGLLCCKSKRLRKVPQLRPKQLMQVMGLSACRYLVFCFQLYAMLLFTGSGMTSAEALMAIPIYYLVLTLLPALPAADPAMRGGVALLVFGAFTSNLPAVALATIMLWMINNIIPLIIGTYVRENADLGKKNQ